MTGQSDEPIALRGIDQRSPRRHFPAPNGEPYPCVIYPMCLRDDDVPAIIRAPYEETMPS